MYKNIEHLDTKEGRLEVSERIRELREAKGLTQDELAEALGYQNRQTVTKWETGTLPTMDALKKLCVFFNISSEYILGLTRYSHVENEQISELTGLSDESIEVLREINKRRKAFPSSVLEKGTLDFINFELEKAYNQYFPLDEENKDELIYTLFATMNEYIHSTNSVIYYRKEDGGLWTNYSNDVHFTVPNSNDFLIIDGNKLLSEYKLNIISNTLFQYRKDKEKGGL